MCRSHRLTRTIPVLAATLLLGACDMLPTGSNEVALAEDYALVMFGEPGASLEGTLGPQSPRHSTDGRSGRAPLPDSLALTQVQKDSIDVLKAAFKTANAESLAQLKAIFDEAKAARQAGKTRDEVHAILATARPIRDALKPAVEALHAAIRAVFTPAQRAWLEANRPPMPGGLGPIGRGHRPPPPPPGGNG